MEHVVTVFPADAVVVETQHTAQEPRQQRFQVAGLVGTFDFIARCLRDDAELVG